MIKPIVIAFLVGFVLLFGAFLVLDTLHPAKPGGAAQQAESDSPSASEEFLKSFAAFFRDSCVKSARTALTQRGVDLTAGDMGAKIETYCACAADRSGTELSIRELLAFKLNPASEPAATKMKKIVEECGEKIGLTGR